MSTPDDRPAWRRPGTESHVWSSTVMVGIGLLHLALPDQLAALKSPEVVGWAIVALAVVLFLAHRTVPEPGRRQAREQKRARALRIAAQVLLGLVVASNLTSLGLLVDDILDGGTLDAGDLLLGGVIVWSTNVAAFAFVFWETDRGGPLARERGAADRVVPDLLFPQMGDPRYEHAFRPEFVDYLYVAFTNGLAFSPTDTMPMSRWTKGLFALESAVSFGTIALVAARAVNILPS